LNEAASRSCNAPRYASAAAKQEDDEEQGEIRTHGRGRGGADLELADAHHDSEQAGERRQEPEQVEFVLLVEHATDFSLWIREPDCLW